MEDYLNDDTYLLMSSGIYEDFEYINRQICIRNLDYKPKDDNTDPLQIQFQKVY